MEIIAIANQKGGVGKTTTTHTIGVALNRIFVQQHIHKRILLVDIDPQGSLTKLLWEEQPENTLDALFKPVPSADADLVFRTRYRQIDGVASLLSLATADFFGNSMVRGTERLKDYLLSLTDKYAVCLIDCPPSLGTLTINALIAADWLLVPVTLDYLSLLGVQDFERILHLVQEAGYGVKLLGYLPVMLDRRYTVHKTGINKLIDVYGDKILEEYIIPINAPIRTAAMYRKSVLEYRSDSPSAAQYMKLGNYILERVLSNV